MPVEEAGNVMLAVAVTLPRIAAAFLVLPLLTQNTVPALVRNSLYMALALVAWPIAAAHTPAGETGAAFWPLVVVKEMVIGIALGFLFGSIFWAISVAGGFIDTQSGGNFSSTLDPIQGHQTTLTGQWLSQLAAVLFMVSGAFMVFLDLLLGSYRIWPVLAPMPDIPTASAALFVGEFSFIMTTALLIAGPVMIVLALIDLAFGLINRYAQQLNVLQFSLAVKHWTATWLMLLMLGVVVEVIMRKLADNRQLLSVLEQALPFVPE